MPLPEKIWPVRSASRWKKYSTAGQKCKGGGNKAEAGRGNGKKLPLCKGAEGTGETDCHDQFANWSRNDTVYKKCGTRPGSRADVGIDPYGELQGVRYKAGRRAEGSPPYGGGKGCGGAGRCGERTERCQWQMKRGERVAAVKISSVRRKAAQKFWAPQQGHRPLRRGHKECGTRPGGGLRAACPTSLILYGETGGVEPRPYGSQGVRWGGPM